MKDLALTVFQKKVTLIFFSNEETYPLPPLNISWSTWRNQQSYKVSTLSEKNTKFSVKTVWHCCDPEIQSRSLKVVKMGKAQWVLSPCKVWHLSYIFRVFEKISISMLLPHTDTMPAVYPASYWSLHTHIFHVSHKVFPTLTAGRTNRSHHLRC